MAWRPFHVSHSHTLSLSVSLALNNLVLLGSHSCCKAAVLHFLPNYCKNEKNKEGEECKQKKLTMACVLFFLMPLQKTTYIKGSLFRRQVISNGSLFRRQVISMVVSSEDKLYLKRVSSEDKLYLKIVSSDDKLYLTEVSSEDKLYPW